MPEAIESRKNIEILKKAANAAAIAYATHLRFGGKADQGEEQWIDALTDGMNSIEYRLENEVEFPPWINIKERWPSVSGKYIVCTEKGSVYSTAFRVYGESGHFQTDINTHITHWMPMPEPPKE